MTTKNQEPREACPREVVRNFSEFHYANREPFVDYAERRVRRRADAEEIVDQVFEELWAHRDEAGYEDLSARALDLLRSGIHHHVRDRTHRPVPFSDGGLGLALRGRTADPFTAYEERDSVFEAVDRLPPRPRKVIGLLYRADFRPDEAAVLLGLSPSVVRAADRLAKHRIRELLSAEDRRYRTRLYRR